MINNNVVLDAINREKDGVDYFYGEKDRALLVNLFKDINDYAGTHLHYLSELDSFNIPGSGLIIAQYISQFESESVRGYLIPQLVCDKVKDCDNLILQLYVHFKSSNEYIAKPGIPAPAHIYVRYDNAFKTLKSKQIKNDLLKLMYNPRDAFYLPFTMRMLASWKMPELKNLLFRYSSVNNITMEDMGIEGCNENCLPPLSYISRELRFTAIDSLKHFPSIETKEIIRQYTTDLDIDIRNLAKKALKKMLL